jgi:hypothetical protein
VLIFSASRGERFVFPSPACAKVALLSPLPLAGEGRVRALLVLRFVSVFSS